ncbi:MAG: methylenetetrahydrofolate reductase C-terminal domain-containing protein [Nitrospinae bacterium]|nr:methylenetetrahydrofolate reductase C-terminal domain-containing protein [Nitrospinota bacterium]
MIITKQKPFAEIMKGVRGAKSLFIFGCGDCATLCRTGGEAEIADMTQKLAAEGVAVVGGTVPHTTCHELDVQRIARQHKEEIGKSDAILVLACGAGIQAVGDSLDKPVISGCDSLFIGNSKRQMNFYEKCSACGDCVLNETAGLCPETRCPKGLLNGPCGGAVRGMCEVDQTNKCVWIEIYERLKSQGRLDDLMEITAPKERSKANMPHKIEPPARHGK